MLIDVVFDKSVYAGNCWQVIVEFVLGQIYLAPLMWGRSWELLFVRAVVIHFSEHWVGSYLKVDNRSFALMHTIQKENGSESIS